MYRIIALFGESGAGKDTVLREILVNRPMVHKIIPYTTRPPRKNEIDGIDYYFITEDEFIKKIEKKELVEYTYFNNWYYGTGVDDLQEDRINIGVFNIQGIVSLRADSRCKVIPFRIVAPDSDRLIRSIKRDSTADCSEICRRFLADKQDFYSIPFLYTTLHNDHFYDLPFLLEHIEQVVGPLYTKDVTESFN